MQREIKFRRFYRWDIDFKSSKIDTKKGDIYINYVNLDHSSLPLDRTAISDYLEYTGLNDENGGKIYEGDIIQYDGMSLEYPFVGVVKFQDCAFTAFEEVTGCRIQLGVGMKLRIIGNIYENPELLKN